jgi:CubicO group peptidase (beta-lactamase class C family)
MRAPADFLEERIEAGDFPSASWIVADAEGIISQGAAGDAVLVPARVAAAEGTVYDLASLTKPLVTSLLAIVLGREAGYRFGDRAARFLPEFDRLDKRDITLSQLLTHTSGLPDWAPLYLKGASIPEYLRQIMVMELLHRPGARVLYSDLGFIALGAILERVSGAPLDELAEEMLFERVGAHASFRPGPDKLTRVAATEVACNYERVKAGSAAKGYRGWREGVIRGEPHDQNAFAGGGVAGHAGLFGTARDVYLIAREALVREPKLVREDEVPLIAEAQSGPPEEPRSLAYRIARTSDGRADLSAASGEALSPATFGHNGFTGTSVWIDPKAGRLFVLLTNRVHPRVRPEIDMNAIRREFHTLAARA